jgi:hypothetical protein
MKSSRCLELGENPYMRDSTSFVRTSKIPSGSISGDKLRILSWPIASADLSRNQRGRRLPRPGNAGFSPPQKNVLRVSFERHRVKHNLEIAIRDHGIARMNHLFPNQSGGFSHRIAASEEVVEPSIQAWLSYLLSCLGKEFRLDKILRASSEAEIDKTARIRKGSA